MLLGFSGFELSSKVEELGLPKQTTAVGLTVSAFVVIYYALRMYTWLTIRKAATKGPKAIPIAEEGAHPLFGQAKGLGDSQHHRLFDALSRKLGPLYLLPLPLGDHIFVITDAKIFNKFLPWGSLEFPKFTPIYEHFNLISDVDGYPTHGSVFTMGDIPRWKHIRKTVAQCFSHSTMKKRYPFITQRAVALADVIAKNAKDASQAGGGKFHSIDVLHDYAKFTIDVVMFWGFDVKTGLIEAEGHGNPWEKFLITMDRILDTMNLLLLPGTRHMFFHPKIIQFKKDRKFVEDMILPIVKEVQARPQPAADDNSIWAVLHRMTEYGTDDKASVQTLYLEALTLLSAGYDTTATALAWATYAVASNPRVMQKLEEELSSAGYLGQDAGFPTYDELLRLPYLDAVFKETLRLYPSASDGFIKQASVDLEVDGMVVPKGSGLWVPLYATSRNPLGWGPDSDVFKPERFYNNKDAEYLDSGSTTLREASRTGAEEDGTKRPKKFIPFSEGPRSCVGMTLAITEFKAAFLAMVQRFRFEVDPRMGDAEAVREKERLILTLKVEGGLWIRCIPRY